MKMNLVPLSTSRPSEDIAKVDNGDARRGDNGRISSFPEKSKTSFLARLKFNSRTSSTYGCKSTKSTFESFSPCDSKAEQ
ncbi:hypothetical protein HanRHA438_Chr15g0720671 [Helianthus annuus]|nr:hypothetical protein HanRHA438_Chr15g0720671 [Helianthus annuus]